MPVLPKDYSNSPLVRKAVRTAENHGMLAHGDHVLAGVSGGPDSVALLHLLLLLAPKFSLEIGIAHVNHCLRQAESDRDANFVSFLAAKLDLPYHECRVDVSKYRKKHKLSLEEAARRVRYTFFNKIAMENRYGSIALGHNCDDNAELVLMNILRGSGSLGISGIPALRWRNDPRLKIIRPLISSGRAEIIAFLEKYNLEYVLDSSNSDTRFLRNRIRHRLLPLLRESYNSAAVKNINRLSLLANSEEQWLEEMTAPLFCDAVMDANTDCITLSIQAILKAHVAARRRIIRKAVLTCRGSLRRIGFSHIEAILDLLKNKATEKTIDLPDRIRVRRRHSTLVITREKRPLREISPRQNVPDNMKSAGPDTAFLDMDKFSFPIIVRPPRPGDRFTPLGMKGSQKLKKYFINHKTPRYERTRCPLLVSHDKIIWVPGHRIDESVKVTKTTQKVAKAQLLLA
ncbi:MAG: tRNA lysidine(34) synthetase TilS [Desulfobacteraceae bacterium 4572_123]|nr:MAG: tRNA lysidine(34) synthetase TilS [Desulfobacteraceae bacterium 4572_123]